VWDAATGQQVGYPFAGHTNMVTSVMFSPDGTRIASGSWDTTIRVWEVATGQQVGDPLAGHTRPVDCVAFSPDGKRIAWFYITIPATKNLETAAILPELLAVAGGVFQTVHSCFEDQPEICSILDITFAA
jgi:hypothetical protein